MKIDRAEMDRRLAEADRARLIEREAEHLAREVPDHDILGRLSRLF